jgi:putative transposase
MDMIDPNHLRLSIVKQCSLMSVSRSSFYYQGKGESPFNLKLMRLIDEQWLKTPFFGSRRMAKYLRGEGYNASRKRVRRLMRKMGIQAIYPKPRTTRPKKENPVYPYLLRGLAIDCPNQVWCSDITYLPMENGFMYLVAVMDWHSRKVLSWKLSNTLEADFCVAALEDAIADYGTPVIFNTDQGSQFTSSTFTKVLKDNDIKISMDGKGAWMDNVFIERLWWSLKYECVYINEFEDVRALRKGLDNWISFYNSKRPHSSLDDRTPDEAYFTNLPKAA